MTAPEFERAIALTQCERESLATIAAYEVLVHGRTISQAADAQGIHRSVVLRAANRIRAASELSACPSCGRELGKGE